MLLAAMLYLLDSCCSNIYYVNDPVVSGSVSKKNDVNFAAGANIGNLSSGFHGHASYAITNKIVSIGTFTSYSGTCESNNLDFTDSSYNVNYRGKKFGLGAGYYRPLSNNNYFEVIGGSQLGISYNERQTENFEYRYMKYFVQPGIYKLTDQIQFGLSLRMGIIDYLNYPTGSNNEVQKISKDSPYFYADPSLQVCLGGSSVKVGLQVNYTLSSKSSIGLYKLGLYLGSIADDPLSMSVFLRLSI